MSLTGHIKENTCKKRCSYTHIHTHTQPWECNMRWCQVTFRWLTGDMSDHVWSFIRQAENLVNDSKIIRHSWQAAGDSTKRTYMKNNTVVVWRSYWLLGFMSWTTVQGLTVNNCPAWLTVFSSVWHNITLCLSTGAGALTDNNKDVGTFFKFKLYCHP